MIITFLGHAGFIIEGSKKIVIDPFLSGNPLAKHETGDIKPDLILVSHGHGDHLGDTLQIGRNSNGTVVSVNELALYCNRNGVQAHGMHIGGSHKFGDVKIKLTPAWHGAGLGDDGPLEYLGTPCGFIINMDGKTIYHSGDTGLFGDMELIGRLHNIDLAMLPIGDNFTMGPEDALEAVKMLKPRLVIPMHYNTWPLIEQDPLKFKSDTETATGTEVRIVAPGESIKF
jgi:L-ascorbate metabolism protein UlaG (beta-lactamase superfamily)